MFVSFTNAVLQKQTKAVFIFIIIFLNNFSIISSRHLDKRTLVSNAHDISGQVEQLFDGNNQIDTNYDEYPMVVPKRAALMLDRLMVALHRALEKERAENNRIHELLTSNTIEDNPEIESNNYNMYSDDDPSVLDYDFKDLNAVNRATGETLLTNSLQRRANIIDDKVDAFTNSAVNALTTSVDKSKTIANKIGTSSRTALGSRNHVVWRCFFNAISCF